LQKISPPPGFDPRTFQPVVSRNVTYITIKRKKIGKCGPCPVFGSYTLALALKLRKKHGKPSVMVVEKCPDIPVAVFTSTP
jgi:hypothetical protein